MHSLSRAQLVQSGRLSLQMPADTIVTDRARAANSFMIEAPRTTTLLAALAWQGPPMGEIWGTTRAPKFGV